MKSKIILIISSITLLTFVFLYAKSSYVNSTQILNQGKLDISRLVPNNAPKLGDVQSKIQIVEFLDPECESCKEFYPFIKMIIQEFNGKVQLVIRYAPFHPNSKLAIKMLEASRKQNKYWQVLETLFQYQPQWGSHENPNPDLIWKYVANSGVNVESLKLEIQKPEYESILEREIEDVKYFNIKVTPTIFVNGKILQEFSYDGLRKLILQEFERLNYQVP